MNKIIVYLLCFLLYSLVFLVVGKGTAGEEDTVSLFFTGKRSLGILGLTCTFVGTWLSAATVLGYTGSVYAIGLRAVATSVIPWFIGAFLLFCFSKKIYKAGGLTVPELLGKRYHSVGIQVFSGLVMTVCYVFYLIIQVKGFGLVASSLLQIDYRVAVFLVYLFILYATFDGFRTVVRTDIFHLILLIVGIGVIYYIVSTQMSSHTMQQTGEVAALGAPVTAGASRPEAVVLNKGEHSLLYVTAFFCWGLGLAANPQYISRVMAAKRETAARKMLLWSLIILFLFYIVLTKIGLLLRAGLPEVLSAYGNDQALVLAVDQVLYTPLSGFLLICVIGACISTANSQLLLIGSSMSYDVLYQLSGRTLKEKQVLFFARLFIFLGGTASLVCSLWPPDDMLSFGADIWGVFSVFFFPLLYGCFLFPKATKVSAIASILAGMGSIVLLYPNRFGIHWSVLSIFCSVSAFIVGAIICKVKEKRRHA